MFIYVRNLLTSNCFNKFCLVTLFNFFWVFYHTIQYSFDFSFELVISNHLTIWLVSMSQFAYCIFSMLSSFLCSMYYFVRSLSFWLSFVLFRSYFIPRWLSFYCLLFSGCWFLTSLWSSWFNNNI